MKIITHKTAHSVIAEICTDEMIIQSAQDGLDLLGDFYYQGFDKIIIHEKNLTPDFFELRKGMAGEILQKFSNYRVQLAIVGEFEKFSRKSIRDFISESNRTGHIIFTTSVGEALTKFQLN